MTSYTNSLKNQSVPWRDVLPVHPAAELLPRMSDADLKELGADIAANGQLVPVVLLLNDDGSEQLLDGISRLDAMERAGIPVVKDGAFNHDRVLHQHIRANTDPYLFVCGVNVHRRHLTNEQKTEFIGKVIALRPTLSDRQIASMTGTSHPTVAKVRAEMEASGKITTSPTRTDKEGHERPSTQPAKPARSTTPDTIDNLIIPDFLRRSGVVESGGDDHAGPARSGQHDGADQHDDDVVEQAAHRVTEIGADDHHHSAQDDHGGDAHPVDDAVEAGPVQHKPGMTPEWQRSAAPHLEPEPKFEPTKSKTRKPSLLESWDGTPEERAAIRELVIEEYFATATGAEILTRMRGTNESNMTVAGFLDALSPDGMKVAMSPEFSKQLCAKFKQKRPKPLPHAVKDGVDKNGKPDFKLVH